MCVTSHMKCCDVILDGSLIATGLTFLENMINQLSSRYKTKCKTTTNSIGTYKLLYTTNICSRIYFRELSLVLLLSMGIIIT